MQIAGQAAIVTGGASGLGAATAQLLAERGARVALLDRNGEAAVEAAKGIGGIGLACDVTDPDAAEKAMTAAAQAHGEARILVNCAGIGTAKRIVGRDGPMALADFTSVVNVNLIGSFNMLRLAASRMSKLEPLTDGERGVIVSTASVAAFDGQLGQSAYAASKGGIVSMTLPAARELAQFGIRVMAIAPGFFETPLLLGLPEQVRASLIDSIQFPKRLGAPLEFAQLVESCVTNMSLNGEVIRLDGGLRLPPR
jgi:NAD(P)-dependent dehydrogenase (short-subunit alcohol dehydrogenase family)